MSHKWPLTLARSNTLISLERQDLTFHSFKFCCSRFLTGFSCNPLAILTLLLEMESAIKELNGLGWFQMRATLLVALPLTGFPGFMQMQVFFGQILPHECENDTNKTGSIVAKYIQKNLSDCGDCSMETSYANDFGLLCDNKDSMPYLQRYCITVWFARHTTRSDSLRFLSSFTHLLSWYNQSRLRFSRIVT